LAWIKEKGKKSLEFRLGWAGGERVENCWGYYTRKGGLEGNY
jgi:hypothetical protein